MTAVALFVLAGLLVGYAKTSIGGLATISVVIFATLLPARQSTAALLLVLIIGDLVAVWHYRRDSDWHLLRALIPTVLPGLALGAFFLAVVDDTWLRRTIGVLLLLMVALQLWMMRRGGRADLVHGRAGTAVMGLAAGFATMTANSAGAVMTVYLVAKGVDKRRFLGTGAWFFFGINITKLPFSAGLGLLTWADLLRAVELAPAVLVGAWLGLHTVRRISQQRFEQVVLIASGLSALALLG